MHSDFGGAVLALKVLGEGGHGLQFVEGTFIAVPVERGHGVAHFADDISVVAIWMKSDVARAGTRFKVAGRRIVGGELAVVRVESIDQEFIQAEIRHYGKAVGGGEDDVVSVRFFLALGVDAGAEVLDEVGRIAQHTVRFDRQNSHAAAGIIGDQYVLAGLIDGEMTGVRAARSDGVQRGELAVLWSMENEEMEPLLAPA